MSLKRFHILSNNLETNLEENTSLEQLEVLDRKILSFQKDLQAKLDIVNSDDDSDDLCEIVNDKMQNHYVENVYMPIQAKYLEERTLRSKSIFSDDSNNLKIATKPSSAKRATAMNGKITQISGFTEKKSPTKLVTNSPTRLDKSKILGKVVKWSPLELVQLLKVSILKLSIFLASVQVR